MSAAPSSSDAGFTLVEALVSLFVFSLIAIGCMTLLMQSVASQGQVAAAHAELRELQTARTLLTADLSQLAQRSVRTPDGEHTLPFTGGADRLAFVRASAEPDPELGEVTSLTGVDYAIAGESLVRRSRAHLDPAEGSEDVDRIVFAHAKAVRFEYFDGVAWRTDWVRDVPPRAAAVIARLPRYGEVRIEATTGLAR